MHDDGLGFVKVGHPARGIEKDLAPEVPRQVHGLVVQELVQRTAQQEKKEIEISCGDEDNVIIIRCERTVDGVYVPLRHELHHDHDLGMSKRRKELDHVRVPESSEEGRRNRAKGSAQGP